MKWGVWRKKTKHPIVKDGGRSGEEQERNRRGETQER